MFSVGWTWQGFRRDLDWHLIGLGGGSRVGLAFDWSMADLLRHRSFCSCKDSIYECIDLYQQRVCLTLDYSIYACIDFMRTCVF